jgi:hypothetical protein
MAEDCFVGFAVSNADDNAVVILAVGYESNVGDNLC